jgi:hypothetical protein
LDKGLEGLEELCVFCVLLSFSLKVYTTFVDFFFLVLAFWSFLKEILGKMGLKIIKIEGKIWLKKWKHPLMDLLVISSMETELISE